VGESRGRVNHSSPLQIPSLSPPIPTPYVCIGYLNRIA
jgi:hypothetical protein